MNIKNNNMSFIPTICPACLEPLSIDTGKKEDVIKLMCTNPNCVGMQLKKLQKGIIALEIRDLGPATIENLLKAGITNSYDLFNPDICNEDILINSGFFKKGRALTKILQSITDKKEIDVDKAILSLQLDDIGKRFSEKIGEKISGITPDYTSLNLGVREELKNPNSNLNIEINDSLLKFEKYGVKIKLIKKNKVVKEIKKLKKSVYFCGFSTADAHEYKKIVENDLSWGISREFYDMLIIPDKNYVDDIVNYAKENNIKTMTWKQIKLLFL